MDFKKLLSDIEKSNKPPQLKEALFNSTIKLWQSFELSQGRSADVVYNGITYTLEDKPKEAPIVVIEPPQPKIKKKVKKQENLELTDILSEEELRELGLI
jgi:hypothetical protein|tara:strand:+ start:38 stop:337 length:300 start_codon:yes stop_codon:yes gene_type:complete